MSTIDPTAFSAALLAWYDVHHRELPWRISPRQRAAGARPDPYRIWLSEIMLQQTTVAAVKAYYAKFLARWPGVSDLAAAPEGAVLAEWAGLGYYARARNLHACAKAVETEHGGRFPETAAALKALPGIGDYTSAAIAAIAFDEPAAVVDGNVERVVTRLEAIEAPLPGAKPLIKAKVAALTPNRRPGDFAQAMMDLGATICTPTRPACAICPVRPFCTATKTAEAERYPVKAKKAAVPERRGAAFVAMRPDGAVFLRRRPGSGMLGGMSEPPTTGWSARADGALGEGAAPFAADWRRVGEIEHGFTHFRLTLEVWCATVKNDPAVDGWWSKPEEIAAEALPTVMRKVLKAADIGSGEAKRPSAGPQPRGKRLHGTG
ncbi:A/G-specific adenine glycosylase [Jiella avicenniae]|uniref:Adenine DNA glycosylase n=1 Tax=Jiella avicenniae TaxID=2907202 RepID=A0A9X1TBB7_9HYPH|nr:A/G-specific adenine glycosylase [Jiella avicenniae]MCE7027988.1 A/G-specific adenine glycosylase [Jiella avicenniae]